MANDPSPRATAAGLPPLVLAESSERNRFSRSHPQRTTHLRSRKRRRWWSALCHLRAVGASRRKSRSICAAAALPSPGKTCEYS